MKTTNYKFVTICNFIAAICFLISSFGNLSYGKILIGIAFVVCAFLQLLSGIMKYRKYKG
ncbi:MAG: hypothetical protein SPK79_10070 [Erysipelotrichaceae bacterium]|nr:hypothetical protein [Erysipelotrichaceae bacterium]